MDSAMRLCIMIFNKISRLDRRERKITPGLFREKLDFCPSYKNSLLF